MGGFLIYLPKDVMYLLRALRQAGHSAYVVGGCVRDGLLGRAPGDWDLCTSALPGQIKALFGIHKLILTGEKHGTVTVVLHGTPYEITTYRLDGDYRDHRHPGTVRFVPDLREDLARRDFTINAMAYAPGEGLVDAFGGQDDLRRGVVRCVGDPAARFAEDALRVLRAVRFAAKMDFTLDPATEAAARAAAGALQNISQERVFSELDKLLSAPAAGRVLAECGEILGGAVPEILPCIGCTQPGPWHCYDVWGHTAAAVGALDARGQDARGARILYWAVFLHDLAKPECRTVGPDGAAHFRGHNQRGAALARTILRRLHAPAYLIDGAAALVAVHDAPLPGDDPSILRWLHRCGPGFLQRLCALKLADLDAHAPGEGVSRRRAQAVRFALRSAVLAKSGCYSVAQLAVGGGDLLAAGLPPGPTVGQTLDRLLNAVMDGELPNEREPLLAAARSVLR